MIPEIKYKQFVIIPKKPKMSKGKIASQTAHATFMALENQKARKTETSVIINEKLKGKGIICDNEKLIEMWKNSGMCVIVLQCKNEIKLHGIAKYLEQWGIPHHLYIDEGITEISMGTATALATGVMTEEQFWILGTLKLFK